MTAPRFAEARELLTDGVSARAYPAAVVEVGTAEGVQWREAVGTLTFAPDAAPCAPGTVFDLASLTKVIVTTSVALRAVSDGPLSLDDRVAAHAPAWRGPDREHVTLRHLLDHSSGLPAYADLWREIAGRDAFEAAICAAPLTQSPGTVSVYSDLGFILAGIVLERVTGQTLDAALPRLIAVDDDDVLTYLPDASLRPRIAPTERDRWRGRVLVGEVHDANAAALGGVAAHAGVFGTASAVGAFARQVLATFSRDSRLGASAVMARFARPTGVPGSSRAIGWDTMLPTSSCGTLMSAGAIGHTGFTGTSLWIDRELDLYVVLLTNRVHPTRENEQLRSLRPRIHDAIVRAMRADAAR